MSKSEILPLPLAEMITYCENKGYDVLPVFEVDAYRMLIFKNNHLIKIGTHKYPTWKEGQIEAYSKLFKAISHANKC